MMRSITRDQALRARPPSSRTAPDLVRSLPVGESGAARREGSGSVRGHQPPMRMSYRRCSARPPRRPGRSAAGPMRYAVSKRSTRRATAQRDGSSGSARAAPRAWCAGSEQRHEGDLAQEEVSSMCAEGEKAASRASPPARALVRLEKRPAPGCLGGVRRASPAVLEMGAVSSSARASESRCCVAKASNPAGLRPPPQSSAVASDQPHRSA